VPSTTLGYEPGCRLLFCYTHLEITLSATRIPATTLGYIAGKQLSQRCLPL